MSTTYRDEDELAEKAAAQGPLPDDENVADDQDDKEPRPDWPDIHKEALLEYERAWMHEQSNQEEAYEDLRFRRGKLQDQWTPEALDVRMGRPTLVVNKLPQFVRQVTGDQRKMRPAIEVVPVDSKADIDTADVRGGIIRYIENRSHAKYIYNAAGDSQVTCGIGHWHVTTEYASSTTFNQEIRIELIEDGVSVLWDADSTSLTREDANHCFVPFDYSRAKFKRMYPDAKADGFDTSLCGTGTTSAFDTWHRDDTVRVQVYWKKKPIKRTLVMGADGSVEDLTDKLKGVAQKVVKQQLAQLKAAGIKVQIRDGFEVCRYVLSMHEVLEQSEWKGLHIPVVPVFGEIVRIGHDVYRHGIVRYARDLQRMVNFYASAETEVVGMQPKAPWLGTKKMFQDHYEQWEAVNTDNLPFIEYTVDPAAPGSKPERVQPPVPSQAVQQGMINVSNDMKAVIGIYDASLGAKSNETSGVAIRRRQEEGDTGTYVYLDNMSLAIQRTGVIINDLIPHIYDTERQMRIIGKDNKPNMVDLNKVQRVDGVDQVENDLTVGSYDVEIEQGPNYVTRREEARDGMQAFIQAVPQAAPLIGDLFAEAQDWPHAAEIGERLQEMLPPPIKAKLDAEKAEREQASGQPPKPPTPQQQAMMAQQAKQQQMAEQAAAAEMQLKQAETEEALAKAEKAKAEAEEARSKAQVAEIEFLLKKAALAQSHMGELRNILSHEQEIEGITQGRQHAQDRHEVDMHRQGADEARQAAAAMAPEDAETGAGEPDFEGSEDAGPPIDGAQLAPDGNHYLPDPSRPGKYLRVDPA